MENMCKRYLQHVSSGGRGSFQSNTACGKYLPHKPAWQATQEARYIQASCVQAVGQASRGCSGHRCGEGHSVAHNMDSLFLNKSDVVQCTHRP
eukprot:1165718-Amphidinium_carterae.1